MEKEIKICGYRNCGKEMIKMRSDAKYCCRMHKDCERTYKQREKARLEKNKDEKKV